MGSNPSWGTQLEVIIYMSISPPTTFGALCQDDYRPSRNDITTLAFYNQHSSDLIL